MADKETLSGAERGRLKVFLGYASGVGKSFRMFDEGRRRRQRGQDVVVGALQPKVPAELQPLLSALEVIPTLNIKGVPVIDVDAMLRRRPQICLIVGKARRRPTDHRTEIECDRKLGRDPHLVDTRVGQEVFVESECYELIKEEPPSGGPRLWLLRPQSEQKA